jgi:hypothetical protein
MQGGRQLWAWSLFLTAALESGCLTFHSEHNAPGVIDVQRPPKQMECEVLEQPEDPGEDMLFVTVGLMGGIGAAVPSNKDGEFQAQGGVEGSVVRARSEWSHADDFPLGAQPARGMSFGLNLGWVFARPQEGGFPLYLELQGRYMLFGLAAGVSGMPGSDAVGPQLTCFWGPFYVRYVHFQGKSDEITFGLILKMSFAFVQSR